MSLKASEIGLISVEEFAKDSDNYQVIDARDKQAFEELTWPNAISLNWDDWTEQKPSLLNRLFGSPSLWGRISLDPKEIELRLQKAGLKKAIPLVVFGSPNQWGEEGRIAWNLLTWGAQSVWLLNGDLPKYLTSHPDKGQPGQPPKTTGNFVIKPNLARRIEKTAILAALASKTRPILDARSPEEFTHKTYPGQKRAGHIPSAKLVVWTDLYQKDGTYITTEQLKTLTGLDKASPTPITYCVGGVRSALLALLIEIRLGLKTQNYDGSIWEWSADPSLPLVETAPLKESQ